MAGRPVLLPRTSEDSRPTETSESRSDHRRSSSEASPSQFGPGGQRGRLAPPPPSKDALNRDAASNFKLLGFFAEKAANIAIAANAARSATPVYVPVIPPPRTHSRVESALPSASASLLNIAMTSPPSSSKINASPSKAIVSTGRTYDAKLVTREMHRLGTLAHLPAMVAPSLVSAASASSLTLTSASSMTPALGANSPGDSAWAQLHVHVLPLFNGDPLKIPIEDLNTLVRRHIEVVMSSGPARALNTLENDAAELIHSGMITINAQLSGIDDDKLLNRVVEKWGFFWDQVLPYVEGVFLPLQTDALLLSLYRTPKPHRSSSPTLRNGHGYMSPHSTQANSPIDVRTLALRAFRDQIIYPLASRLEARLLLLEKSDSNENPGHQQPRLQQMLLVLLSQAHRPHSVSLTAPTPSPSPPELIVRKLLDIIQIPQHNPLLSTSKSYRSSYGGSLRPRPPSFLSGGAPRDRRGRVAQKPKVRHKLNDVPTAGGDEDGGTTPRGFSPMGRGRDVERERDRDFLEALRSPELEDSVDGATGGGWGLGGGHEEKIIDDDEEPMDWDHAQAVLERMMGMGGADHQNSAPQAPQPRRKMT